MGFDPVTQAVYGPVLDPTSLTGTNYQYLQSVRSGQVRSGQVRSECLTCTFRASCCSTRLSWAHVPAFTGSSVRDRKKKGGGSKGEGVRGGGPAAV